MNLVIMQARMGSSRLPGKVLKQVCGKTLLELEYERIKQSDSVDRIIVATTINPLDDAIEQLCLNQGLECFRGSEDDVLDRYYQTARFAKSMAGDAIVRVTGDCPLLDPEIVDQVLQLFRSSGVDYASNVDPPTYPDGMDVEVFKFTALERAWQEARLASEREHVTPYLRKHAEIFTHANLKNNADLSDLRLTVDEPEDLEIVRIIYESLYPRRKLFSLADILELMNNNDYLIDMNKKYKRNEGYEKSLQKDIEL